MAATKNWGTKGMYIVPAKGGTILDLSLILEYDSSKVNPYKIKPLIGSVGGPYLGRDLSKYRPFWIQNGDVVGDDMGEEWTVCAIVHNVGIDFMVTFYAKSDDAPTTVPLSHFSENFAFFPMQESWSNQYISVAMGRAVGKQATMNNWLKAVGATTVP